MHKCFASTQQQGRFHIILPLPRPFTQMPAKETLSLQTIYITRKHKPDFHQTFTKPDSSAVQSLSLEFLYSSLARYQAQRKVLAFSQALLANRTFHHSVFKDPSPLPPKSLQSIDHTEKPTLPYQNPTFSFLLPSNLNCASLGPEFPLSFFLLEPPFFPVDIR